MYGPERKPFGTTPEGETVELLRLRAEGGGSAAPAEAGGRAEAENPGFDPARFRALEGV